MLAAVVFDFDGVIVDTEPLHYEAFTMALEPEGISFSWDDYLAEYIGFDDRDALRAMFAARDRALSATAMDRLIGTKARAFAELAASRAPQAYPGVAEVISEVRGQRPLGLCSGALLEDIQPILRAIGLHDVFDAVVTAEDVAASKPDPESYTLILERLRRLDGASELPPAQCLAIEDTPAGIAAARAAGLNVLAVSNTHPVDDLRGAVAIRSSLEGLGFAALSKFVSADNDSAR